MVVGTGVVGTTVALLAAGCSTDAGVTVASPIGTATTVAPASTTPASSTWSATAGAATTTSVPPATWQPCTDTPTLDCASVSVPLVYANPSAGTTTIRMARQRAAKSDQRLGTLFVNPGGPGGSGIEFLPNLVEKLPTEIKDRFDVVGFDPRGVGQSDPIECLPNKDTLNGLDPDPATPTEEQAFADAQTRVAAACTAKLGSKLSAYGTTATARDLDVLRQAVGDDKLTYLGFSYGTEVGAVYATLFPNHVRAMVLDGAVDPNDKNSEATQAAGFQLAFDRFVAACAGSSQCVAGPDAKALYERVKAAAEQAPIPVPRSSRSLTPGYLLSGVGAAMYDKDSWPLLAQGLADADAGNGALLLALADSLNDRKADGSYGNLEDAHIVISCDDDPRRPTLAEAKATAAELATKDPLLGGAAGWGLYGCEGFPNGDEPLPKVSAPTAPKLVVIGTKNDPATPFANTAALAKELGSAVTVSWDGDGHTATTKSPCVDRAVSAYLVQLAVPTDGLACTDSYKSPSADPFVLDRSELRSSLSAELTREVGASRAACIADAVLAKLDDTQLLHFLSGVIDDALGAMIRSIVQSCPG